MAQDVHRPSAFAVVARQRPFEDDGGEGVRRVEVVRDLAVSTGARTIDVRRTLTPEGDLFVTSHWDERADAERYLAAIAARLSDVSSNAERTELRSPPLNGGPAAFHALLMAAM